MSDIGKALNDLLFPRRPTPKSQKVAVYPDGRRFVIRKEGGVWLWDHGAGSYPLAAAIENVERAGGRVIVEKIER